MAAKLAAENENVLPVPAPSVLSNDFSIPDGFENTSAPQGNPKSVFAPTGLAEGAKVSLRKVLSSSPHDWKFVKILRDGHCLFTSFVLAMRKLDHPTFPKNVKDLRAACAKQLFEWNGIIPGLDHQFALFDQNGNTTASLARGESDRAMNLQEYCKLLETSLYGGFEEMQLIARMFNLRVYCYVSSCYQGGDPIPQVITANPEFPVDAPQNAGKVVFALCQLVVDFVFIFKQVHQFTCCWRRHQSLASVITPRL
jgi:hypothetical protein